MRLVTFRHHARTRKSFATHCLLGPALVTADEVPDPANLALATYVNGERRQFSNTNQLIFDGAALIEFLSTGLHARAGRRHLHRHAGRRRHADAAARLARAR